MTAVELSGCRVTSTYRPGEHNRPPGTSEILQGHVISKADTACKIQGSTDRIRNTVGRVIYRIQNESCVVGKDFISMLEWLSENVYSYASYCYCLNDAPKDRPSDHVFSQATFDSLKFLDSKFRDACYMKNSDFLTYFTPLCLDVDLLRVEVRELESTYWGFTEDPRIITNLRKYIKYGDTAKFLEVNEAVVRMGNILNILSSALYSGNKLIYEQNAVEVPLKEWGGKAADFIL